MENFSPTPHHDVLVLLVQVTVLLIVARALGEGARRMGQPTIVGEILAGIVLGPSLLSSLVPSLGEWLVPQTQIQVYLLEQISLLGAMFMMLITGLEIDLMLIRRHARSAIGTGVGGLVVPFVAGYILAQFLPDDLVADPEHRLVFYLFVATALSLSAIPVIAKVMMDLNMIRRDISQILISAAMIEDALAWMMLSVFINLAEGEGVTIGGIVFAIGNVLLFIVASFTIGRWFVRHALDFFQDHFKVRDSILSLVIVLMFAWGAIGHALHLEAVIGAFTIGILFSQMRHLPGSVVQQLESVAFGFFAPLFFAVAGLKVNLLNFLDPRLAGIALLVIVVASVGKIVGAYLGARLIARRDHWTALSFGVGLNTHGAIEIIIATIGLSIGVFTPNMFSIIVLMSVITSLLSPSVLRWVLRYVKVEEQEEQRLRHEEMTRDNPFAHVHRVLVPVRRRQDDRVGPEQMIEATVLQHIGAKKDLSVTLLNVANDGDRAGSLAFLEQLGSTFRHLKTTKKVVVSNDPTNVILDEARKEYDLLVMGATSQDSGTEVLFNPIVDSLIRLSPCPSLVVQGMDVPRDWQPRRILAPTNGSIAARRAVQAAFSLASNYDSEVLVLKVVKMESAVCSLDSREEFLERQYIFAHQIVDELGAMGQSLDVRTYTSVLPGYDPETVVLDVARSAHMDLIILGTNVRAGSERLYLGARVERVIRQAPCPVVIVNSG